MSLLCSLFGHCRGAKHCAKAVPSSRQGQEKREMNGPAPVGNLMTTVLTVYKLRPNQRAGPGGNSKGPARAKVGGRKCGWHGRKDATSEDGLEGDGQASPHLQSILGMANI